MSSWHSGGEEEDEEAEFMVSWVLLPRKLNYIGTWVAQK